MKKIISVIIVILLIIGSVVLFVNIANSDNSNNETVKIDNERYEIIDSSWTPYNNTEYNGEYYLYKNDSKTIFAKSKGDLLSDGTFYHNTNDVYPDISMTDKIDKVVLEINEEQIVLNNETADLLIRELSNTQYSDSDITKADISTAEVFINVYYKNYPAYQNEFVLCYSNSDELGVMYCETEKNNNTFGVGNMKLLSDSQLVSYINSL